MIDEKYTLQVEGGQYDLLSRSSDDSLPSSSVWIYRFYDAAASTFGRDSEAYRLEGAAEGLRDFIELVLAKTRDADRVHLVAHSMGGLVCRSLLQRVLDDPLRWVSKLFTYAPRTVGSRSSQGVGSVSGSSTPSARTAPTSSAHAGCTST